MKELCGRAFAWIDHDVGKVATAAAVAWSADVETALKLVTGLGAAVYIWLKIARLAREACPECGRRTPNGKKRK